MGLLNRSAAALAATAGLLLGAGCLFVDALRGGPEVFAFSHDLHVTGEGLDCVSCHESAEVAAEAGVPGYDHASWVGVLAPAKTPAAVISRLHAESAKIVQTPEVKAMLLKDGLESVGDTPGDFAGIIKAEIAKWEKVVKTAGIKAE